MFLRIIFSFWHFFAVAENGDVAVRTSVPKADFPEMAHIKKGYVNIFLIF
jgi:hypothetical protein